MRRVALDVEDRGLRRQIGADDVVRNAERVVVLVGEALHDLGALLQVHARCASNARGAADALHKGVHAVGVAVDDCT